jgi:hypothetical protein
VNTKVVEIVRWRAIAGVSDDDMKNAVDGLVLDLHSIGGFIDKKLYRKGDEWIDLYDWETLEDAQLSSERMASKQSFAKLISLVRQDTISIEIFEQA